MVVVSAIIENDSGHVLLAQRPEGKKHAGLWEFPGGKLEVGETSSQALHRELDEELSLVVRIEKSLGVFPYRYDWGGIELHVFIVRALNLPKPSPDVSVFQWVKPSEIDPKILVAAEQEPLVAYLLSISPK